MNDPMNRVKGARKAGQVIAVAVGTLGAICALAFLALVYWAWVVILGAW